MHTVEYLDLEQMDYKSAWDYQELLLKENIQIKSVHRQQAGDLTSATLAETRDHLLFVEHPPVYTLGKSGHLSNLLISEEDMQLQGIEFYPTNRGGDITFHGPGQLVGYPILDLEHYQTDIGKYLRNLEEVIIKTVAEFGITGERSPGETGVWIEANVPGRARKICAMGVRCSRWITMHGFALNVNTNLDYFKNIIPCGITDKSVTSIQAETGHKISFDKIKEVVKSNFEKVFEVRLEAGAFQPAGSIA